MLYIFIVVGLLFLLWLAAYLKNKKAKFFLPFLILIFITPFYELLDQLLLVKIFGCGCVPSTQTNMLHIAFNANDLRLSIYCILNLIIILYSSKIIKTFKNKSSKNIYIISIFIFNIIIIYLINTIFMWG